MDITVYKKRCIICNVVGNNTRPSDFVMKYGLEMLIEVGIRTISIGEIWIRSVSWAETSNSNKKRFYSWGAWA